MKLTALIILSACLTVRANSYAQKFNLAVRDAPLEKVFEKIRQQSDYQFIYTTDILRDTKPVTISVSNVTIEELLELCFKNQQLAYSIIEKTVVVKEKKMVEATVAAVSLPPSTVKGRLVNENGEAIAGASVIVKETGKGTYTDNEGKFELNDVPENGTLKISGVNIEAFESAVNKKKFLSLIARVKINPLDEVHIIAYGTTTQRLSVGSVTKISREEIASQPVSNPLAALEGRAPGLLVTQGSGLPGSSFTVSIRGRSSLAAGFEPLFIIDGVPFATQNNNINQLNSVLAPTLTANNPAQMSNPDYGGPGLSPFSLINPADIESIEVLRDADATAIYGSRGAGGVVLITTKKGKAGKTTFGANVYSSWSTVTRKVKLLNTQQYLQMRHEAFNNDGIVPDNDPSSGGYAPDLFAFDTTKYTDFAKMFFGGTAKTIDANVSVTGGTANTNFLLGAGYRRDSYLFPGDFAVHRGSLNANINHQSADKRFQVNFSANYAYSVDNTSGSPSVLSAFILPPNYPDFFDANGNLVWSYKGVVMDNPMAYLYKTYKVETDNLLSNLQVEYQLFKGLAIRSSFGYSGVNSKENSQNPKKAQDPERNPVSYSSFGTNNFRNWIAEPQLEYKKLIWGGKLDVLVGSTFQHRSNASSLVQGSDYSDDALMGSIVAAATVVASDNNSAYNYTGAFGRIMYNWKDKYIVNLSGRRDGSSRFGPGKRFGNFGSVGAAWVFTKERFFEPFKILSFGKIRGSYGTTGNDNIGEYQYLSAWSPTGGNGLPYQGTQVLLPQNLPNTNYSWEQNRKLEAGLDLGLLKDRIFLSVIWYRSRSSNQLINYILPTQAGFTSVVMNFPALVQNTSFELQVSTTNIRSGKFSWTTSFNLTIPKNKVLAFPGIENSSYYRTYFVGYSISEQNGFTYRGVDPATGIYQFQTKSGLSTAPVDPDDLSLRGNLDARFYGGMRNNLSYRNWHLDLFIDFRKQIRLNYIPQINVPGSQSNQPVNVLDRWQHPGDQAPLAKFTSQVAGTPASDSRNNYYAASDGPYTDASFIKFRTIALSYDLPFSLFSRAQSGQCKLYINVQNLFTITGYKGNDPEVPTFYALPPLRAIAAGLQLTL